MSTCIKGRAEQTRTVASSYSDKYWNLERVNHYSDEYWGLTKKSKAQLVKVHGWKAANFENKQY